MGEDFNRIPVCFGQTNKDFYLTRDGASRAPDPILQTVFPLQTAWVGRYGNEVNGLTRNTVPVGVLQSGAPERAGGLLVDRIFHLVEQGGEVMRLRVCLAMPGEDYEAFAVIHDRAPVGSLEAQRITEWMREAVESGYLKAFPSGMSPTLDNAKTLLASSCATSFQP